MYRQIDTARNAKGIQPGEYPKHILVRIYILCDILSYAGTH